MNKKIASLHYALMILIVCLLIAVNFVAYSFSGIITAAICGTGINLDEDAMAEATKEGAVLAEKIAGEGITLVKNENNSLPLKKDENGEIKINVFGKSSSDECFVYQGYGSGGGSREKKARVPLYTALREKDIKINESLAEKYNAMTPVRNQDITGDDRNIYEAPTSFYTDELMNEAKNFSDTALVVISRCLGEAYDAPMTQSINGKTDESRHYLELTAEEEFMLDKVTNTFDNVIVLLNSTNVMECGFLENDKIDSALFIYAPGFAGTRGLGDILNGNVNPSGKTVDTWAYDFSTAATYVNSGEIGSGNKNDAGGYVDYAESIYVGYYWYETADAEGYWNDVNNEYGKGYEGVVQYPFGYGLSYTDFEWTIKDISLSDGAALDKNTKLKFTVLVENTGSVPGSDVVELYFTPPYKKGGIEKPAVKLGAFAKTAVLDPGVVEELTLEVDMYQMASYDVYDANGNGYIGYEAEAGDYTVSLRTDAHTVKTLDGKEMSYTYKLPADVRFETDPVTGNIVTNRFTTFKHPTSGAQSTYVEQSMSDESFAYSVDGTDAGCNINYMTRANFKGTFPNTNFKREASEEFVSKSAKVNKPKINSNDEMPKTGSRDTSWTLNDLIGAEFKDPRWTELVQQLTVKQMAQLCMDGGWGTSSIASINKPYCSHSDGPSGFNRAIASMETGYATNFPCETLIASTWNWKMAYQFGLAVGKEAEAGDIQGWYGPACDIHRSPFSGRNFEYYSEDPYISGIMVSYTVQGAQEKGLYAFVKHFVVADTEPNRNGKYTWLTEQALREIYLKQFEYAVKLGKTTSMMTAYNRVGATRCSGSYALNTEVLRNEWGFEGCVISDYYAGGYAMDEDEFIRAGNDLKLLPGGKPGDLDDTSSATAVIALQKSSKNILYGYLQTRYIGATSQGLDMGSVIGTKTEVFPWWVIILVVFNVAVVGGCGVWGFFVFRKMRRYQKLGY